MEVVKEYDEHGVFWVVIWPSEEHLYPWKVVGFRTFHEAVQYLIDHS